MNSLTFVEGGNDLIQVEPVGSQVGIDPDQGTAMGQAPFEALYRPFQCQVGGTGGDPDGRMFCLMDFTERPREVADPWYTRNFDATWDDLYEGCEAFLRYLVYAPVNSYSFA